MNHRWYVVNVHSGSEKKVAEAIREKVEKNGLSDRIVEVLVPTHEVMEVRRGKKTMAEKKFFPGYVLVKMDLAEDTWHLIKHVAKVSGFLGGRGKPTPMSEAEVTRLLSQVEQGASGSATSQRLFEIGEQVRVCDGPFASFNGVVEEIDQEKARLKVSVLIFGRSTPVDLEFDQVEKL